MSNIDEGMQNNLHIKLINHLTGEITEVDVESAEQAKNLLIELSASETVIKKAKDRLRSFLDDFLGQDDKFQFADGKVLSRKQKITLQYRLDSLRKYLDADQLEVCLKVDNATANQLIGEMVERGELPNNTLKLIREEADQKASKPYVEVR